MKRSELIDKIIDKMWFTEKSVSYDDLYRIVDEVIAYAEEFGMKPPLEQRDAVLLRTEHVWEKEDV